MDKQTRKFMVYFLLVFGVLMTISGIAGHYFFDKVY